MDSLLSRTGLAGVCNHTCTDKPSAMWLEASPFVVGAPVKSVQICTGRSPPSQLRAAAVLNNASSTEETTCKGSASTNSFNPLLFIASHSTIPTPLKFLWINKKEEQASETVDGGDLREIEDELQAECDKLFNDSQEVMTEKQPSGVSEVPLEPVGETEVARASVAHDAYEPNIVANDTVPPPFLGYFISRIGALLTDINYLKTQSTMPTDSHFTPLKFLWINKKEEQASETVDGGDLRQIEEELQAECHKLFNDSQEIMTEKQPSGVSEVSLEPVGGETEVASASMAHDAYVAAPNIVANDTVPPPFLGYFISKIGALLTDINYFKTQSTMPTDSLSPSKEVNVSFIGSRAVDEEARRMSLSSQNTKEKVLGRSDAGHGCCLEAPYVRVVHTKESFSKFLQETSLYDMKVFTQLAFLCDMAYMIPSIQPGQLMKYHRLSLVTTSLVKKAGAQINAQEKEGLKKVPAMDSEAAILNGVNGCANSQIEHTSHMINAEPGELMPAFKEHIDSVQNYASRVPGVTRLLEEIGVTRQAEQSGTSFVCRTDSSEEQRSPVLKQTNKIETLDNDALLAIAQGTAGVVAEKEIIKAEKDVSFITLCPCEWFVCDEQHTHIRTFVIQGSESLASWQTNLFFEPTQFEGSNAFVHRGIYDAARALYDQVLPEVIDHVSRHGHLACVRFTGHSLGGSLAVLLALMLQVRGVLPRTRILPVVTFGSPFIMCGGDHLLQTMQLPVNHIQSVIMHKDIVPRAFACDYPDHVAEVLRRLNGRFRDHPCLTDQKLLYAPMGQLYILQPTANAASPHPLLPDGHGLYALNHPLNGGESEKAIELRAAQRAFLNLPHPLDILGDPAAYGFDGTLSRNHDPRRYTKAIQVVLKDKLKRLRRVHREQRRKLLWPSLTMASSSAPHKNLVANARRHSNITARSFISASCQNSLVFRRQLNNHTMKRLGLPLRGLFMGVPHYNVLGRYARELTLQRIQAGMLLVVSLRIVISEYMASLSVYV